MLLQELIAELLLTCLLYGYTDSTNVLCIALLDRGRQETTFMQTKKQA